MALCQPKAHAGWAPSVSSAEMLPHICSMSVLAMARPGPVELPRSLDESGQRACGPGPRRVGRGVFKGDHGVITQADAQVAPRYLMALEAGCRKRGETTCSLMRQGTRLLRQLDHGRNTALAQRGKASKAGLRSGARSPRTSPPRRLRRKDDGIAKKSSSVSLRMASALAYAGEIAFHGLALVLALKQFKVAADGGQRRAQS